MSEHGERAEVGIIGGTGLYDMEGFADVHEVAVDTPFGAPSDELVLGTLSAKKRLLDDAVETGATVAFYHDLRTPLAKVGKKKDRYVLSEVTA